MRLRHLWDIASLSRSERALAHLERIPPVLGPVEISEVTRRVKMEYSVALRCLLTQLARERAGEITNCGAVGRVLLCMRS